MNNQIEVGCLAIAILPTQCCASTTPGMNLPFKVMDIIKASAECIYCGRIYQGVTIVSGMHHAIYGGHDIRRCIRIDPPAVNEAVENEREVTV